MEQRITELCLIEGDGIRPFAVLVEDDHFSWATPAAILPGNIHWQSYLLERMERRPEDSWVFQSWHEWLNDLSEETPERRKAALKHLEYSTPGIVVRTSKTANTRLPSGALSARWCRDRLLDSAEVISAEIAANLTQNGIAHWNSSIQINDYIEIEADWIVENYPVSDTTSAGFRLAMLSIVDAHQVDNLIAGWQRSQAMLGSSYPYSVGIVRNSYHAKVLKSGCLVGDRFAAPVSLAVSSIRAAWNGIVLGQPEVPVEPASPE